MTIGIIGATGRVGRSALEYVPEAHKAILGSKNANSLKMLNQENGERFETVSVDIYDAEALKAFCRHCNVVINAAPAALTGTRLLEACIEVGCSYIDPMDTHAVCETAKVRETLIKATQSTVLTSAGAYPGLSEYLAGDALAKELSLPDSITGYFQGNADFSKNAARDIVSDMRTAETKAFCQYSEGHTESFRAITPSAHLESKYAYPVVNDSFFEVCKRHKLKRGIFYNCFSNRDLMNVFFETAVAVRHDASITVETAADKIYEKYKKYKSETPATQYTYYVEWSSDGDLRTRKTVYRFDMDWNRLTGQVCGVLAAAVIEGQIEKGVIDFGAMPPNPFVTDALEDSGLLTISQTLL